MRKPDIWAHRANSTGADLVSSAIAEVFEHQPIGQIQANPGISSCIKVKKFTHFDAAKREC
jgi:hypothetical protein